MELEKTGFSIEGRVLCSDDACIGVVGPDRLCKVCGRLYEGDEPLPAGDLCGGIQVVAVDATPGSAADAASAFAADSWDPAERVPCFDDACVGIIGKGGRCGTCGRGA